MRVRTFTFPYTAWLYARYCVVRGYKEPCWVSWKKTASMTGFLTTFHLWLLGEGQWWVDILCVGRRYNSWWIVEKNPTESTAHPWAGIRTIKRTMRYLSIIFISMEKCQMAYRATWHFFRFLERTAKGSLPGTLAATSIRFLWNNSWIEWRKSDVW